MESFQALGVSAPVAQALAARDIVAPFRIQTLVLPDALAGRDILAKAPTGSGKTIAFGIPVVERLVGLERRPGRAARGCGPDAGRGPARRRGREAGREVARMRAHGAPPAGRRESLLR